MEVILSIYASKFSILICQAASYTRYPPEHLLNGGW